MVVVSDRRVPVVSHALWYKVGSADEPPGKSGIAHLLEHLMFKGTKAVPQGEFSRIVSRNGGQENAFTSYDYTGYYQNIASDRLGLVMKMEADRMTGLLLTPEQVAPEKLVVLEERRQRVDNDPAAILGEAAQAVRYLNHPYRRPIIGWEHEIESLSTDDVLAFYRSWYAPNNAVLVVAGDVTAETVRPLAEQTYGRIPRAEVAPRLELRDPPHRTEKRVFLADPRVRQPAWTRSWPAPSYRVGDVAQAYPLQVLAEVIGGGPTSRLFRDLVVDRPLAVGAAAWYDASRRGPSEFVVYASPRPGVELATLREAIEALLTDVLARGLVDDEVERAKRRLMAGFVYAQDSFGTPAQVVGQSLSIGLDLADVAAWPDRIRAVTRAQVEAAARAVLRDPGVVTAELLVGDTDAAAGGAPDASPTPVPAAPGGAIR